ncbi:MAG: chromosome segregation protein, partial [Pseudomonadota bacterium]
NQFAEIAVKRVLTRDGNSSYLINNQVVRRRDVQDVFLGTGLGPRAYAIIGQGTSSRIIESRPEELRLFLDEAAGVSNYKERRRETAHRLSDTRDNLTRVEDILRELNANLDKLEKQAEVALQYKTLLAGSTLKQHQLWFLKRAEAEAEQARIRTEAAQSLTALEGRTADLRRTEADLETLRQAHYAAGDAVNQAQGALYESTAEVGKLEAEIRFVVEGRRRVELRLAQLAEQAAQWAEREAQATEELEHLSGNSLNAEEQAEILAAQLEDQAAQLPTLEDAQRHAQAQANTQRQAVVQMQQSIQVLGAEQRSIDEQTRQLATRRDKLGADRHNLGAVDETQLADLQDQLAEATQVHEEAAARLEDLQEQLPVLEDARRQGQQRVNAENATTAQLTAKLDALRALQDKVQSGGKLRPWLAAQGLEQLQPLWKRLHTQPGWENALEAALRERMGALEVSRLDMLRAFADNPPATRLAFFTPPDAGHTAASTALPRLVDVLTLTDPALYTLLAGWLHGCFTAPTLEAALAQRDTLHPGEAIYVPSGHAVQRHSVSFYAADSEQAGLLARAQEIEHLDKELRAHALIADEARHTLARAEAAHADAAQRLAAGRVEATQAQGRAHALQVEVLRLSALAEQARQRREQIAADQAEVDAQLEELQERRITAEGRFEELDLQLADAQERHAALEDRVIEADRRVSAAREQLRTLERQAQEAAFSQRSLQARQAELARSADTARQQVAAVAQETQRAHDELGRLSDAAAQGGLQEALEARTAREHTLAQRRSAYDALTTQLRAADERRLHLERDLEPMRQRITDFQLKEQAARIGFEQYTQLLAEAQHTSPEELAALAQTIAQGGVRLAGLQGEIDRLQRDMTALGPVNLAALDELATARERKTFLDAQSADLNEAMQTLEDAIKKIDAETRDLLSSTFEAVNTHFGRMFPELFGGGQAKLVMTGDEILDAGVQVMAQPPGKKNQTIHLLSGGEKALTAIALVFAIFQLNPAPFCLLDEVDAPLDDANTERYAKLVSSMSRSTQFLFISHNKIAMEMAEQLIGVTMQEQGVSRIVAVDMEAAVGLVHAS